MTTANPELVAAAPTLIKALQLVEAAAATILTGGDPLLAPARVGPALTILLAQVQLLLPALATAELGAVNADIGVKIGGTIAQLQAVGTATVTTAA
jgi:hypothetical protein